MKGKTGEGPPATGPDPQETGHGRQQRLLAEALFLFVTGLAVTGLALTNASPALGYRFWLITVALFAVAGVITGNLRARAVSQRLMKVTVAQAAHWGVTLLAVLLVHLLVLSGRITYEAAGFVMMLLIGEAVALDGIYQTGWRFAVLGLVLMAMAIVIALFSLYIWVLLVGGLVVWGLLAVLEHGVRHRGSGAHS
jgi:hypothetical protein